MDHQKVRVFVADDHPMICDGLRDTLVEHPRFEFAGRAANEKELFERLNGTVNLLILDIIVEEMRDLLGVLKKLRGQFPELVVVIFTGREDFSFVKEVMNAGVKGFLSKTMSLPEVCEALLKVLQGRVVIELDNYRSPENYEEYRALMGLTRAEKQALSLFCKGFNNDEAADFIGSIKKREVSPDTVGRHKTNLRRKLRDAAQMNTDFCIGYWVNEFKLFTEDELWEGPEE